MDTHWKPFNPKIFSLFTFCDSDLFDARKSDEFLANIGDLARCLLIILQTLAQ